MVRQYWIGADYVSEGAVTRAQQFEEVQPALRARRAEPGEIRIADLRAEAVRRLMTSPAIVHP
jgi:hypothetical protein